MTQADNVAQAVPNLNLLGGLPASCSSAAFPFACSGYFRKCFTQNVTLSNGTTIRMYTVSHVMMRLSLSPVVTLPQDTCKSVCDKFVNACPLGSTIASQTF